MVVALAARRSRAPGAATGPEEGEGARHDRILPFLGGAALALGAVALVVRSGVAAVQFWDGTLPVLARAALASVGAAASAALLLGLNALARPRGLAPAWVLVLAGPFLYVQAIGPFLAVGLGTPGLGDGTTSLLAAGSGLVGGVVTFLGLWIFAASEETRVRVSAAALAVASTLQALAILALATEPSVRALQAVAVADVAAAAALVLTLRWGADEEKRSPSEPVVTLRPTG